MFSKLKKHLYFSKITLLLNQGYVDKSIVPFEDEMYKKMETTYISGLPVSIHIKYLKPMLPPGKCIDRSLYMFFCFDDAVLVRANIKNLEYKYGIEKAGHGWIEIGDYVYDPTFMMRFDKDLYYKIFIPIDVTKCTHDEYCNIKSRADFYNDIKNTTIDDLKPYGRKRLELSAIVPLIEGCAKKTGNQEFVDELNDFLSEVQYDEEEITNEINEINKKLGLSKNSFNFNIEASN